MLSFLILHNNEPFFDRILMCIEKWILYGNCNVQLCLDWESSKALPKTKLTPKKDLMFSLVVCWQSDSLQLSESCKTCYIWEICPANQWDALRNAMPAASVGQQNGPNSSPQQCLTAHHTTKASKVEQIGLHSCASSAIFTWPLVNQLPLLQASQQLFAGKMFP